MKYIELKDACFSLDKEIIEKTKLIENGKYEVINSARGIYGYYDKYNNLGDAITIASRGEYAGFINYMQKPFFAGALCYPYRSKIKELKTKFLYYFLKSKEEYIMKNIVVRGSIPALNKVDFDKMKIPIPPLKLQEDIIEKLDKFTEYINLLNEELDLRQKQFEYYKNKLLTFGNDVLKVKLKEIGTVSMCKRVFKDQTSKKGEVPFYKIGSFGKEADSYISSELFEEYKKKYPYPKKGNVLISASGTIGKTVIYNGEKAYYQDSNIVWLNHDNTKVLDKYLYYFYNTFPWKITEGGTIPRLYNNNILNTELPLPTIEKQIEIVNILDKFEAICNVSLPEEIALREKQYEYYRDLLLSF